MNRYVMYNFVMVSLLNLMLFVPNILLQYRYNGAIPSLITAAVIGPLIGIVYIRAITKFPGKGVPEILNETFPRWVTVPSLLFFSLMWFSASSITVDAFAVLISRFFNPDANVLIILTVMCAFCLYAATRSTLSVLFTMEIMLLLNVPLIVLLLFKAGGSEQLNWDEIRTAANYVHSMPRLAAVAAATFIFTGYLNLSIYNRALPPNYKFKRWPLMPAFGIGVLATSYFIPIGMHGVDGVSSYLYVWSATSDSLAMEYGFIERVLFVFLVLYLNLTLIYTASGWHQAMEFIKSCFPKYKPSIDEHPVPMSNYVIVSVFAVTTIAALYLLNEKHMTEFTSYWLIVRMFVEYGLVVWIVVLSLLRRRTV